MFKKESDILFVCFDETVFKAAHCRFSAAERRLINIVKRDTRDIPEEELSRAVQSTLAEFNLKKPHVIITLPVSSAITKNIEIPSLDPEEIRSIIDLQAGRHTPYPREEILVGYITIGVFQRNYTKVLLVLVNRAVIKKQLALLADVGAKVDKIVFAPEANAHFYAEALHVKEEDVPVGVIDIAGQSTLFLIEFNKTVAMCRNIPVGISQLIKEGPAAKEKLLNELAQSLEAYQSEDINRLPESFVLTSDDVKLKDLQPDLQTRLKANIKIMSYLDLISAPQPVLLKIVSEYNDDSFLNLLSAMATLEKLQIDLTPDEVKTERAIEEKGRLVFKAIILAIAVLLIASGIFFSKLYFKSLYLERVKAEYVTQRKAALTLERVNQRTRIIKTYVNSRMTSLDVVATLYNLIPDEIYLENVTLEEDGSVNIQGVSESMSRVFNFVTALEDSDLFKGVKTKSTTAKKDRGKDVAAFELGFKLKSAKEDETEEGQEEGKDGKGKKEGKKDDNKIKKINPKKGEDGKEGGAAGEKEKDKK